MPTLSGKDLVIIANLAGFSPARTINGVGHDRWAAAIALAESGGRTDVIGPTKDYGLWQINEVHKPTSKDWKNPLVNAQMAYEVYRRAGYSFRPWTTYPAKASLFLSQTAGVKESDRKFYYEGRKDILREMEKFGKIPGALGEGAIAGLGKVGDLAATADPRQAFTVVQDWIEEQALRVVMFAGGVLLLVLVVKKAV